MLCNYVKKICLFFFFLILLNRQEVLIFFMHNPTSSSKIHVNNIACILAVLCLTRELTKKIFWRLTKGNGVKGEREGCFWMWNQLNSRYVGSNSFIDYIFTGLLASIFSNVKNAKSIKMKLTNKTFPALTVEIEFVSICI